MTDPQLPPPGAVPPVPPVVPASDAAPVAPDGAAPQPPAYAPAPPAPYGAAVPPPANPAAPTYPPAPPVAPPSAVQNPTPYGQAPAEPYAQNPAHAQNPGYAQNPAYAPAPQAAPPGAYQVPVGGYPTASGAYSVPDTTPAPSATFAVLAFVLGIVAAVVVPILAGVFGAQIGARIPSGIDTNDPNWIQALSPAREQVLWAEISFWTGTVLGIAAIVFGILSIRRKTRRALGIIGLVLAVLGPVVYWFALIISISVGIATGPLSQ